MPFTDLKALLARRRRREQLAAAIVWSDRALRFAARWGVPSALAFLILSGPVLPQIGGGLAPYAGLRSLHVLAGLGLALAMSYRALETASSLGLRLVTWVRRDRPAGRPFSLAIEWPDPVRALLSTLHGILMATVLWTGIERYCGQRWGVALIPVLSPTAWSLAHRLVTPYYVAALLLLWFVKSRVAWRRLLEQWRRP